MDLGSPMVLRFARAQPMIECAQCGDQIFTPDWSEYLDDRRVRHLWGCEACGYLFETIARFPSNIDAEDLLA